MEKYIIAKYENFLADKNEEDKKKGKTYLSRHYKKVTKELKAMGVNSPEEYSDEIAIKMANQKFSSVIKEGQIYVSQRDIQRIYMYIDFLNIIFPKNKIDSRKTKLFSYSAKCPNCGKEMAFIEMTKFSSFVCEDCGISQTVAKGSSYPTSAPATKKVRELRKRVYSALNNLFTTNNSKNKYPFITRIVGKKNEGKMDNLIAFLDEADCNHVLNAVNFILGKKKEIEGQKTARPLWWKVTTNWISTAKVEDFRWLWLADKKILQRLENGMVFYDLQEISRLAKVSVTDAKHKLWELYAYGAPVTMNIQFLDNVIKSNIELLDSLHYETVEDLKQKLVFRNFFPQHKPEDIFHICCRYHRVKIMKELNDLSIEEVENRTY